MRRSSLVTKIVLLVAAACVAVPVATKLVGRASAKAPEVLAISVEQNRFVVTKADGARATNDDLIGAELVARTDDGVKSLMRIDAVRPDPMDKTGARLLYTLSTKNPTTGVWANACLPGPDGIAAAFPVAGRWSGTGEHLHAAGEFEVSCTSGAIGKCVRFGYEYWQSDAMWDRHQACTRMLRGDYCGDGQAHTKNGTMIDLYDTAGIQSSDPDPGMTFEAAWGKDGAVCVSRTRLADVATVAAIETECPQKLVGHTGSACTEDGAKSDPRTLLMNKSQPSK